MAVISMASEQAIATAGGEFMGIPGQPAMGLGSSSRRADGTITDSCGSRSCACELPVSLYLESSGTPRLKAANHIRSGIEPESLERGRGEARLVALAADHD